MDDRARVGQRWRICVRVGVRAALILGAIGGVGSRELCLAAPPQHSQKLISQQFGSPDAERFSIYPRGITLGANQRQRFAVIDATGRTVAVHWNVSGLSCSGVDCGTIDDNGDYLAPESVARAQDIVLEGVLVSDPEHSVLAQIRLAPTVVARPLMHNPAEIGRPAARYKDGLLTIDAVNVTLAEVLELVARETGAVIDVPSGAGLERIVEHAGPAPANEVLAQLLNGSRFNFVIVNSPQTPYEVVQVILSLRGTEAAPVPSVAASSVTTSPTETMPPEVLEQMMKDKAREIRESGQQQ
jgi:hypothetical protein